MTHRIFRNFPTHLFIQSTQGNEDSIFDSATWYCNFEKHICFSDFSPRYLVSENEGRVQCLPVRKIDEQKFAGIFHLSRLSSLSNYYSPYYSLSAADINGTSGTEIVSANHFEHVQCFRKVFSSFHSVDINPMIESEMEAFKDAFKKLGFFVSSYVSSINWYEDEIEDSTDYWSRRQSKLKNTIRRRRDKIDKSGQFAFSIFSKGDLLRPLSDFHHVYYSSWKTNEPFPAFIDQLAKDAMDMGKLRIGLVHQANVPVAAQMWFVENETAYIFKLAHCPQAEKHSLGSLLTAEMVNHVLDNDRVSKIDFLTGNDPYKKDWMSKSRPLYHLTVHNTKTFWGVMSALKSYLDKDQNH